MFCWITRFVDSCVHQERPEPGKGMETNDVIERAIHLNVNAKVPHALLGMDFYFVGATLGSDTDAFYSIFPEPQMHGSYLLLDLRGFYHYLGRRCYHRCPFWQRGCPLLWHRLSSKQ